MVEKIGPYRVVERLGVGGMGEVYKAYDDRLDRWVAIKRIRPDKENTEDNRERFQREARATAKLNHASIVHVYDIFLDGDSDCIVMEYVEGRTLDSLILEGPLDPMMAARLGYEIASGLAEAHAKGIIHRDLKVENIILTLTWRAKILDFGLAKPIISNEFDASLTGKGQLVGTSRAMSPEYVSGEEIDHRSDLFSFGVLLYEATTGHSPFKSHNTLATLKQVMLHIPTPAYQVNPQVSEEFSHLIDRLLEKDPADRPQSSDEVALEFESILGGLSSEDIPKPRFGGSSTFRRSSSAFSATATAIERISQRPWIKGLALLVALVLVGLVWMIVQDTSDGDASRVGVAEAVQKQERILVGAFDNRTGDATLTDAAALAFRTGLEQASNLEILSKVQIRDALKRMEKPPDTAVTVDIGTELCKREGVKALVFGSLVEIGGVYQVIGSVIDPKSGTSTQTEKAEATSPDEIIEALNQVSLEIRVDLGESLEAVEETVALQKVTTSDFQALTAYSLGNEEFLAGRTENAIELLQQAIGIDADFAMAHAKLAIIYIADQQYGKALGHLKTAHENAIRLTSVENFYVDGWYARLTGTAPEIIQVWTLMTQLYPERYDGYHNKGMALWQYHLDFEQAAVEIERALGVAKQEDQAQTYYALGFFQLALGEIEEAENNFNQIPNYFRQIGLAQVALIDGDLERARKILDDLAERREASTSLDPLLMQFYLLSGDLRSALQFAQNEAEQSGDDALQSGLERRLSRAAILEVLDPTESEAVRRALTISAKELASLVGPGTQPIDTAPVPTLSLLGKLASRNQAPDLANAIHDVVRRLSQDKQIPVWNAYLLMLEGEMLLANGDEQQAIHKFQSALDEAEIAQAHESLGRAYRSIDDENLAKVHYQWINDHRGRVVAECSSECIALNTRDWILSGYHLGNLYLEQQDIEAARRELATFVQLWNSADDSPALRDAKSSLETLSRPN